MPAYTASSCRTVTVLADHHNAPNEKVAESLRRHVDLVRAALIAAGAELHSVPSGHYPHVEVPEVTAERFSTWVGS